MGRRSVWPPGFHFAQHIPKRRLEHGWYPYTDTYTHQTECTRKCRISLESLPHPRPSPSQCVRDGKILIIPSATVLEPDSSRLSGIPQTFRHLSEHLWSERSCWNRESSKVFLKLSTMFVVLKWISSFFNLLQ